MKDPALVQVTGPLAPFVSEFSARLERVGYARASRVEHLLLVADLSDWMEGHSLGGQALDESLVERFVREHPAAGRRPGRSVRSFRILLEFLREVGAVPPTAPVNPVGPAQTLLAEFSAYLAGERGLAEETIRRHVELVGSFLAGRVRDGALDLASVDAGAVSAFMLGRARSAAPATVQRTGTALRCLLHYLHLRGLIASSLTGAVPSTANWKLAGLPKYLTQDQVEQMVASCDRGTVVGCRDAAIVLLLARLGLRAGEVAALSLDDLDWRLGELTVRGKGNRRERLPLPADVGEALATYLTQARPEKVTVRQVFITVRAPRRALSRGAVTQLVGRVSSRCGLGTIRAHRLRHTAATSMLGAGGSLEEIGQVLGHRHLLTTAIYAKVDHERLRPLARPWPGEMDR